MILTICKEEMKSLNQKLSILSADTASQIEFLLATREVAEKVVCQARITTDSEQIIALFYAQLLESDLEKVNFTVSAKVFIGLAGILLSYDTDILLDTGGIKNKKVHLKVTDKVEIPMEIMSIDSEVKAIEMGKDESVFFQATISTEEFKKAARVSCFADEKGMNGIENTHVYIDTENGRTLILSCDQYIIGKAGMNIKLLEATDRTKDQIKKMDEALGQYCETTKQTRQEVLLLIPARSFSNLQKVIDGVENFAIALDSKHVFIATGRMVYTLTKGAVKMDLKKICDMFSQATYPVSFSVEYGEIIKAVSSLSRVISLKALKNTPVCISVESNAVRISICGAEESGSISVCAKTSGTGEIYLNADRLERVVSKLDGNKYITVEFGDGKQAVRITKGRPESMVEDQIYIMPVKAPVRVNDKVD